MVGGAEEGGLSRREGPVELELRRRRQGERLREWLLRGSAHHRELEGGGHQRGAGDRQHHAGVPGLAGPLPRLAKREHDGRRGGGYGRQVRRKTLVLRAARRSPEGGRNPGYGPSSRG